MATAPILAVFLMANILSGCMGPAKVPPIETIETNETAFLVPLEGANKENQEKFMSLEYLEAAKVSTKRIEIPVRERSTGRMWWDFEWIPNMRVIKVDRTPQTREWTKESGTGTAANNQAIDVESSDSIGFSVGVNLTASILEEDAATFLYYYAGKELASVVDSDVRGFISGVLAQEFGRRELQKCKTDKADIAELAITKAKEHFAKYGITIVNLALVGGLQYDDEEIQSAINRAYTAEMEIQTATQEKLAQVQRNANKVSIAVADRQAAQEFAKAAIAQAKMISLEIEKMRAEADLKHAEASVIAAGKWSGNPPQSVVPANSGFLFGLDGSK